MKSLKNQVSYGNWVSQKLIASVLFFFVLFTALAVLFFVLASSWGAAAIVLEVLCLLLALFFLAAVVYFVNAKRLFSYSGGRIQQKVLDLVVSRIDWDGKGQAIDIGCGSGALAIGLAHKYPDARITGIDYWGGSWGYYQKQCEANAAIEGVSGQIVFQHASASALPCPDETFDLAVSNLVFHEVKDTRDKRDVVREALRVVKKGGRFVFQDLFLLESYYGKMDEFVAALKSSGIQEVSFVDTSKSPFIPGALKLPFMVGTLGLLYGVK